MQEPGVADSPHKRDSPKAIEPRGNGRSVLLHLRKIRGANRQGAGDVPTLQRKVFGKDETILSEITFAKALSGRSRGRPAKDLRAFADLTKKEKKMKIGRWELDKHGHVVNPPFYYEYSLEDFDGDKEEMLEDLEREMEHFEQVQGGLRPDEPNFLAYPQGPADDRYLSDMRVFELVTAIRATRPKPQAPSLSPFPDDEHWKERREAEEWEADCLTKAERAKAEGDFAREKTWRDRAAFKRKDLEALGPSKAELAQKEYEHLKNYDSITLLGEFSLDDSPFWDSPRAQHDSKVQIHRVNNAGGKTVLVLPKEESPFGAMMPIKPSNMLYFDLPQEVAEEIRQFVYSGQEEDQDALFRRTWDHLHKLGYANTGKPTFSPPKEEAEEKGKEEEKKEVKDPDEMSQKEFEAEREKGEKPRNPILPFAQADFEKEREAAGAKKF